jgi:hypothetical protein
MGSLFREEGLQSRIATDAGGDPTVQRVARKENWTFSRDMRRQRNFDFRRCVCRHISKEEAKFVFERGCEQIILSGHPVETAFR